MTVDASTWEKRAVRDSRGRPLPVWQGCRVVGADEVFLMNWQSPESSGRPLLRPGDGIVRHWTCTSRVDEGGLSLREIVHRFAYLPFGWSRCHSSIPAAFQKTIGLVGGRRILLDRHKGKLPRPAPSTIACRRTINAVSVVLAVLLTIPLLSQTIAAAELQKPVAPSQSSSKATIYAALVTEAFHRFAIPEHWICAVIEVESGWNVQAVSPRGALGLMQIMPQTWVELSVRYQLGLDPFDPYDNIMAGTAYPQEMLDRFGSEGFLAAYNAGPRRYAEHLTNRKPLPEETRNYVAKLAPLIGVEQRERGATAVKRVAAWQDGPLFVGQSRVPSVDAKSAPRAHVLPSSSGFSSADAAVLVPHATGLFVPRASEVASR